MSGKNMSDRERHEAGMKGRRGIAGGAILGDGRVVLILNLPAVVEHVARSRPQKAGMATSGLLLTHTDRMRLALTPAVGGQA